MLISAAPIAIPISTANPATEAVASEAAQKPPIPKLNATVENPNVRSNAEQSEQPKNNIETNRETQQNQSSDENSQQSDGKSNQEQAKQEQQQQTQTPQESKQVEQLKRVDREVRAHEAAHANVGGQLAGAPNLSFKTGPDGKRYAVAGEVSIDTSRVPNNPEATIRKMRQVRSAALAPASPSSQDFKVAALASQNTSAALLELTLQNNDLNLEDKKEKSPLESGNGLANPVTAKRFSLQLNQKINQSGALIDVSKPRLLSQTA